MLALVIVQTNDCLDRKFAPNIDFGSKFMHQTLFIKMFNVYPYFGRKICF